MKHDLESKARATSRDLGDILREFLSVPAAHAAEIEETPEPLEAPGALKRLWDSIKDKPLIRRVRAVASWIGAAARFLWAIPKAVIQGDSDGLIEALGGILAQASAADDGEANPLAAQPALRSAAQSAAQADSSEQATVGSR